MNPRFHPQDHHWLDYAAGQMDPASRSLLEAHLAFCDTCREQAGRTVDAGARLLAPAEPAPDRLLEGILARLKPAAAPQVGTETLPLPRSVWSLLPDLGGAAWKGALTRGFRFLEASPGLFLIHMEKGRPFPEHGHRGLERSLILAGGLRDGREVLEAGDFDESDATRVHTPVALADEDCWLLASLDGGIRFSGWRGALQRLAGK
ncbi:MAG TPA: cupin domain-containing protein [Holophaga sp.]|nr:cupin domain-containing protein [Holophaga sp.]